MPKYSIIIPSYDPSGKKIDMVTNLVKSIEHCSIGKDYELIIRKNGKSYTDSHNDALLSSRGEFIVVLNDDTFIEDIEWLDKINVKNSIMTTKLGTFYLTDELVPDFSLWAMHRDVFKSIGLFDTRFSDGINFEDNDYAMRAKKLGFDFTVIPIYFKHFGNQTFGNYYKESQSALSEKNHALFYEKWRTEIEKK